MFSSLTPARASLFLMILACVTLGALVFPGPEPIRAQVSYPSLDDLGDIPPDPENPVEVPAPPPLPTPLVTFSPEWIPPPPGESITVTNHTSSNGSWAVSFPQHGVTVPVGPLPPGGSVSLTMPDEGTVPPGTQFQIHAGLATPQGVVIVSSNVYQLP